MTRIAEDIQHAALFDHFAMIHDDDAFTDLLHHFHLVGDHHDRDAEFLIDLAQQGEGGRRGFRVESRGGFVRKQNSRVVGQGSGNTDTLLLTAGKLRGILLRMFRKADELKQRRNLFPDLVTADTGKLERQGHVVVDRAGGEQVEVLEDHADLVTDAAKLGGAQLREILTVHNDIALCGPVEEVDTSNQRGFARAASSEDTENFSVIDCDGDILDGIECRLSVRGLIGLPDMFKFNHFPNLSIDSSKACQRS